MTLIEIPDEQAASLKAKAAAQEYTLEVLVKDWLKLERAGSRRGAWVRIGLPHHRLHCGARRLRNQPHTRRVRLELSPGAWNFNTPAGGFRSAFNQDTFNPFNAAPRVASGRVGAPD